MATEPGLVVSSVRPGSLAAEMEIEPGDKIMRVNDQAVTDLVDFQFLTSDDYLQVDMLKANGELWELEIEKEPSEDFGVQFATVSTQGIKHCRNKCVFCFVDQMPGGMRSTLYEKDDDYRLSLTQGSFITLTNLNEQDIERIKSLHLSPLYVSVHATNPAVRQRLLNNPQAGKIMEQLKVLADAGIIMHTQVVLVPGLNDGEVLAQTVKDLAGLWPQVQSIAVVPVGLTEFRQKLAPLQRFSAQAARQVVEMGDKWQTKFRQEFGKTFLYFSDEFYVEAELNFPPEAYYDDFPQLENGVGLSRLFLDEIAYYLPGLPQTIPPRSIHVVTGISAAKVIDGVVEQVCQRVKGLEVEIHALTNSFFGPNVTVAGLLTGKDLVEGLQDVHGETVLLPKAMLKSDQALFLDDLSVAEVAARINARLIVTDVNGLDFLEKLLGQVIQT